MSKVYKMFIGGEWIESITGDTITSINPATEEPLWEIQAGSKKDVERAVEAAKKAFHSEEWKSFTYKDRADLLREIGELILNNAVRLSQIETAENGKPIKESSLIDIPEAAETFKSYASMVLQLKGETFPSDGFTFSYTIYEPLGVVAAIIPWNYPLLMAAWKIAPALAAGNTIVIKPSEYTSATLLELAKLLQETSLPDGVVNIITGTGEDVGAPLSRHPEIEKISFTGSTATGASILQSCAESITPATMELGGKSATILTADAYLATALPSILTTIFMNQGEMCVAGSRLLVDESIIDTVIAFLNEKLSHFSICDGSSPTSDMGPLISVEHFKKVSGMVDDAISAGAVKVVNHSYQLPESGYFYPPTVLSNVAQDSALWNEEVFGPVLILDTFSSIDEAIEKANNSSYGLALSLWSQNNQSIQKVSRAVHAGTIWINTYGSFSNEVPFGGFKKSGFGKELGLDSLLAYCRKKSITQDISPDKTPLVSRWYGF